MPTRARAPKGRTRQRRVALLFETTNAYARALLQGVGEYVVAQGHWSVTLAELGANDTPPRWLERWQGDGVIVRGESRWLADAVRKLPIPCVDLTPSRLLPRCPWVKSDDGAIAELAARHFLERGFEHFAFCGDDRFSWAVRRGEHYRFSLRLEERGCAMLSPRSAPEDTDAIVGEIGDWLARLPKPVAVFACYDNRGQQVLEACRRRRLAVPEQVAVLGVDNDEVLCMLSPPPLSSVMLNPRRAGWEAASRLDQMMGGAKLSMDALLIPPVGIVTRQSSDILAVPDPRIAAALRFVREHACAGIRVSDILRHTPMARRALEMRFRKLIGRTPRQEILRVQISRVRELLVNTALPLWEVAERTGFEPDYLSVVFKQETGMAPREYRRRYGRADGGDATSHGAPLRGF